MRIREYRPENFRTYAFFARMSGILLALTFMLRAFAIRNLPQADGLVRENAIIAIAALVAGFVIARILASLQSQGNTYT